MSSQPGQSFQQGNAKVYGLVGSLLILLSPFTSSAFFVLFIAGVVLLYLGLSDMSSRSGRREILSDGLRWLVFGVVSVLVLAFTIALFALSLLTGFRSPMFGLGIYSNLMGHPFSLLSDPFRLLGLIGGLALFYVLLVISSYYLKRSYDALGAVTGINTFSTAGLLFLLGGVLTVIGVGILLILVGWLISVVAWASVK